MATTGATHLRARRQMLSNRTDLTGAAGRLLREVGSLPGVTRVFPAASALSRWFDGPITHFRVEGCSVRAWVTIAVGRHESMAAVTGLVTAYVRARLQEQGFDSIEIRVRVALLT